MGHACGRDRPSVDNQAAARPTAEYERPVALWCGADEDLKDLFEHLISDFYHLPIGRNVWRSMEAPRVAVLLMHSMGSYVTEELAGSNLVPREVCVVHVTVGSCASYSFLVDCWTVRNQSSTLSSCPACVNLCMDTVLSSS